MTMNVSYREPTRSVYSPTLMCRWNEIRVLGKRTIAFYFPHGSCCNMGTAVAVAEALMPGVLRVHTYQGGVPDIIYFRTGTRRGKDSEWRASPSGMNVLDLHPIWGPV